MKCFVLGLIPPDKIRKFATYDTHRKHLSETRFQELKELAMITPYSLHQLTERDKEMVELLSKPVRVKCDDLAKAIDSLSETVKLCSQSVESMKSELKAVSEISKPPKPKNIAIVKGVKLSPSDSQRISDRLVEFLDQPDPGTLVFNATGFESKDLQIEIQTINLDGTVSTPIKSELKKSKKPFWGLI